MVQQSFHDRIARTNQKSGQPQMMVGPAATAGTRDGAGVLPARGRQGMERRKGPGFIKTTMIGLLMVPVGMAVGLMTTLFLDPEITPQAAHYLPLMGFVLVAHLGLFAGAVTAIVARFRRQVLNYVMLFAFAGYGLASAALSAALG